VDPRPYTAADISNPAVLDAPLSVTDKTSGIRGGADVPTMSRQNDPALASGLREQSLDPASRLDHSAPPGSGVHDDVEGPVGGGRGGRRHRRLIAGAGNRVKSGVASGSL